MRRYLKTLWLAARGKRLAIETDRSTLKIKVVIDSAEATESLAALRRDLMDFRAEADRALRVLRRDGGRS